MAFHISRQVGWASGREPDITSPSSYKYFFCVELDVDVVRIEGTKATISVTGNYRVLNSPSGGPPNRLGAASDFATIAVGSWDINQYAFDHNRDYYQQSLPFMPNASSDFVNNNILLQFRGDTWSSTGNLSTAYQRGQGLNPNSDGSQFDRTYSVNQTFTIDVPTQGDVPIITWNSSGWTPSHQYDWLAQQTWASWFDLSWEARIKYDANGGTNAPADTTAIVSGASYQATVASGVPTRKNFIFHGWSRTKKVCSGKTWYYASDADIRAGDRLTIERTSPTVTLYAVWEYTYRPGQIRSGGVWQSCDRDTGLSGGKYTSQLGACKIRRNGQWVDIRTRKKQNNMPPTIRRNGSWETQDLIGNNASCHDVSY